MTTWSKEEQIRFNFNFSFHLIAHLNLVGIYAVEKSRQRLTEVFLENDPGLSVKQLSRTHITKNILERYA